MAFTKRPTGASRLSPSARKQFFAHLAETANVSASARIAGVDPRAIYRERERSAAFRDDWMKALAEGYVRLETKMLADALVAASSNLKDQTLKARALKQKVQITLLTAHRANVRGAGAASAPKAKGQSSARQRVEARFAQMRKRAEGE
jgi:hypothetical protein